MPGWSSDDQAELPPPPLNPFLREPLLYVGGLTESVPDEVIVEVLHECLRVRLDIQRPSGSAYATAEGAVAFESLDRAEKAYATVNDTSLPNYGCDLTLHTSPPPAADPAPNAAPRIIKSLPLDTTAGRVFDLFRPYGPLHRVKLVLTPAFPAGSGPPVFKGQAQVVFYEEEHARIATEELHCAEFGGSTIIVQLFEASRVGGARRSDASSAWADTPPFVPGPGIGVGHPGNAGLNAVAPVWTPPTRNFSATSQTSIYATSSPSLSPSNSYNLATGLPPHIQTLPKTGAAIDPCNLFIKNLDPGITSQDLYNLFGPFGKIVSARVMRDDHTGISKEFGFVSYTRQDEAANALTAMDGTRLVGGNGVGKNVVVRLHEPKRFREGRMRDQRVVSNGSEVEYPTRGFAALSTGGETSEFSPQPSSANLVRHFSHSSEASQHLSPEPSQFGFAAPLSPTASPPSSSPNPAASEHDRLLAAVRKIEPTQAEEIVALIASLPKKERALCLFNPEHLRTKVADALEVLASSSDDETPAPAPTPPAIVTPPPSTSLPTPTMPIQVTPSFHASSILVPTSLAELGRLPATEIMELVAAGSLGSLGIVRASEEKESETGAFMVTLEGKPAHEIKQKLGDRLFKAIKGFGVKGAPRITIQLLDTEELKPLSHLINYPDVLKEKVLSLVTHK